MSSGEAVAWQTGIENGDLAAGTAELQGAGKTGKTAADDDDVIHGDGLRLEDGLKPTHWLAHFRYYVVS
jgi:hypothetical protein